MQNYKKPWKNYTLWKGDNAFIRYQVLSVLGNDREVATLLQKRQKEIRQEIQTIIDTDDVFDELEQVVVEECMRKVTIMFGALVGVGVTVFALRCAFKKLI